MKATCDKHGAYNLSLYSLPECPECIRSRMVFPDGEDPKHAPTEATRISGFKSFRSSEISTINIFQYMAAGDDLNPTGCKIYYYPAKQSFNAVSLMPCGKIPGSGARDGSAWAAELAVLQDLTGKSSKGPHFAFEEVPHFEARLRSGEWVEAPKCVECSNAYVYSSGDKCSACLHLP